jgi:tetrahydromethanopterin S-methyltransferase subunit G
MGRAIDILVDAVIGVILLVAALLVLAPTALIATVFVRS